MKSLIPRSTKAIDQQVMSEYDAYSGMDYVPLANHQTWTLDGPVNAGMNYIAVYQCVRVLSNVFASVPLKLYRRRADGGKEEATDHPLYEVLHLQPNPAMTSFVWRKIAMRHLATWGNHYSEIVFDQLGRLQLWPISPDRMEVKWRDGRRVYTYVNGAKRIEMKPGSVFHMQGQTTDGLIGWSPIAELRKTLTLALTAERYGTSVFDNGARPAVVMSHPKTLSPSAISRLGGQMDELRGSRNAGKTVVLEEGLTVTPIGFPPEDAQFLETRLTQHRLIYGAYGVPPHKVGDLERATFSNIEHQSIEFIQDAAVPWYVNAEQEFRTQLIEDSDVFVEFLVDGYLRGDSKSRAEALAIRWQHGNISPDDWRALENENPLPDGLGKKYYVPVNYQEVGAVEPPAPAEIPGPDPRPGLVSVKSMMVRCANCNHLLIPELTGSARGTCTKCKTPFAVKSAEERPDPVIELSERIAARLPSPSVPDIHFHEGAFKAGDVHVHDPAEAPIVNVPPTQVNVPTDSFVGAIKDLKEMLSRPKEIRKTVIRDSSGRITGLVEEEA